MHMSSACQYNYGIRIYLVSRCCFTIYYRRNREGERRETSCIENQENCSRQEIWMGKYYCLYLFPFSLHGHFLQHNYSLHPLSSSFLPPPFLILSSLLDPPSLFFSPSLLFSQSSLPSLLIASRFHPEAILMHLLDYVAPSRPIVVYSQFQEVSDMSIHVPVH